VRRLSLSQQPLTAPSLSSYRTITFIKWQALAEVAPFVDASLFYDDDLVFFSNPFRAFEPLSVDFRHQAERGAGCNAQPNGGLLFVRSSEAGLQLLAQMLSHRDEIEASGDKLDQDYVLAAAHAAGVSRCAFPKDKFAGHCRRAQSGSSTVGGLVTYHAHCCSVRESKLALMERVDTARKAAPGALLRRVDQAVLPGFTLFNDSCYKAGWGDMKALRGALAAVDGVLQTPLGRRKESALVGRGSGDVLR
jgi:hypothetical protein